MFAETALPHAYLNNGVRPVRSSIFPGKAGVGYSHRASTSHAKAARALRGHGRELGPKKK